MRCKNCKRQGAVIRLRTQDVFCRLCGHSEPLKKKGAQNEPKQTMDTTHKA